MKAHTPIKEGDKVSVRLEGTIASPAYYANKTMYLTRYLDEFGWLEIECGGVRHVVWYNPDGNQVTITPRSEWVHLGVQTGDIWAVKDQEFVAVQDLNGRMWMRRVCPDSADSTAAWLYEPEEFGGFNPHLIRRRYTGGDEAEAVNLPS